MTKKIISLVMCLCMVFSLVCVPGAVFASNGTDAMTQIQSSLSEFKRGDTISLDSDDYIGIPVDVSVYYDSEAHGRI